MFSAIFYSLRQSQGIDGDPEPVMVDFEMIDKKAAAPKVGKPPPQPKDVPIAEEATKAPPPKSAEPPPAPEKPKPDVAEAKLPERVRALTDDPRAWV